MRGLLREREDEVEVGPGALGYMLGGTRGQGARWVGVREARTAWQVGARASGVAVCGACCGQQAQLRRTAPHCTPRGRGSAGYTFSSSLFHFLLIIWFEKTNHLLLSSLLGRRQVGC